MIQKDRDAGKNSETRAKILAAPAGGTTAVRGGRPAKEKAKLFDSSIVSTAQQAVDFITNILESSTEYSVIAKDLEGKILLWNEGARRLYGYEPSLPLQGLNLWPPQKCKNHHWRDLPAQLSANAECATLLHSEVRLPRKWNPPQMSLSVT